MLVYLAWSFRQDKQQDPSDNSEVDDAQAYSTPVAVVMSLLGLGALLGGADMLVDAAITLARAYGVSELIIGLSLIALGTSLPEVVMAVVASLKKAQRDGYRQYRR